MKVPVGVGNVKATCHENRKCSSWDMATQSWFEFIVTWKSLLWRRSTTAQVELTHTYTTP